MQYFADTSKKIWQCHKKNMNSFILIWEYFEVFLLNIIKNSVNCMLTAAKQFKETEQKLNQFIYSFNTYLSTLKAQLSFYSEEHKVQHLFTWLCQQICMTLMNYQELSDSQNALLSLTLWLKNNLLKLITVKLKAISISHKVRQHSEMPKLKTSIANEMKMKHKWENKVKTTPHSSTDKDKSNITCYKCQKKEHYVNECSDRDFNLNKLSVSTVLTSKKGWASMTTSHHWGTESR